LLLVSLLIVGLSIWIALSSPTGWCGRSASWSTPRAGSRPAIFGAGARTSEGQGRGRHARQAFNRMTGRLEEQTGALVTANAQLDSRRAFIEAVLSGVTAGIISVDQDRSVRLINSSAEALLKTDKGPGGRPASSPSSRRSSTASSTATSARTSSSSPRAASRARSRSSGCKVEGGHVLTFDDITEQLLDQRRAAWSDVARRIAHEIKNPLTPIQLAAERLQRRYGKEITSDARPSSS
jgi:two-component system nitrogen regulation sensor histidine kinase NtrY